MAVALEEASMHRKRVETARRCCPRRVPAVVYDAVELLVLISDWLLVLISDWLLVLISDWLLVLISDWLTLRLYRTPLALIRL